MPASHFRASAIGICIYVWLHMAGLKWHLITPLVKRKSWLLKKNQILHEKKTMNYDFRVHTLFHKDFSMVLFEDKIIEKPYGVFIYTSYGCSTSCCLWNIMWFSLCETWRQREFALKKFHSHEIFVEENIGINVWFVCHYSLPKACYWKIQNLLSTLRYTLAISFQVWFSLVW